MEPQAIHSQALPTAVEPLSAEPSDEQLVKAAQAGDTRAFDVLVRKYQRRAVAVSYRLLGSSHDALEVTQDAFLKAFGSIATIHKPEAFGGWLMRIVANLSLNYRRSRKSRNQLPLDDLLGPSDGQSDSGSEWMARNVDPAHGMESREMGGRLQEALAKLPEKQRQAIVLFTIEEWPQKEIAQSLECSVEAVKWHVFQARKKLKELMKDYL